MKFRLGIMGLGIFIGVAGFGLVHAETSSLNGSITLDSVANARVQGDSIAIGNTTFFLKFTMPDSSGIAAFNFIFSVSSPDGATWSQFNGMKIPGSGNYSNSIVDQIGYRDANGQGSDTVAWVFICQPPLTPIWPAEAVPFSISFTLDESSIGKTICLDSATTAPQAHLWSWVQTNNGSISSPDWGGPYCFTITRCCLGKRGNFHGDLSESPNVDDLTHLILYMFNGGTPPACLTEVDLDATGTVNVHDLVTLVAWMFNGAPQPPVCP